MTVSVKRLFLYTTSACHLCEQAQNLLEPILLKGTFQLQLVEISDDDELMERYGLRIPVIRRDDSNADLGWPFDEAQVKQYLQS